MTMSFGNVNLGQAMTLLREGFIGTLILGEDGLSYVVVTRELEGTEEARKVCSILDQRY